MSTVTFPELVDAEVIARDLGVTTTTIIKWVRQGRIPAFKATQKTIRFDRQAVMDTLAGRAHAPTI